MSGLSNVLPEHGGRVVLRRARIGTAQANYVVQVLTPAGLLQGSATVTLEQGTIEFQGLDAAPSWLLNLAKTLLRAAWRGRSDGPWPRRLTRWREPPQT